MKLATILLVLIGLVNGQLNFEGNPLTENTEYTAVESRLLEKTARQKVAENTTDILTESSENFHPSSLIPDVNNSNQSANPMTKIDDHAIIQRDLYNLSYPLKQEKIVETGRHLSTNTYNNQGITSKAQVALNTFLNSKTPEESRLSLDHYLQSKENLKNVERNANEQQLAQQQPVMQVNQQPVSSSSVNQHLTAQLMHQRQTLQALPVNQPIYNSHVNPIDIHSTVSNPVSVPLMQQQQSHASGIQARNDVFYPGWYQRVRRVHGKPFPYAQSRIGSGIYVGPVPPAVPFKQKGSPVEVIYTKPPGFHRGPPIIGNPSIPYEDANAWFPEVDHPPSNKDIYYSQLYAQSYDPYYYNYIAKTGKIKPHLYGKLGKYHEEEDDGIWSELYQGFKKHGLKNIMTPTFLLGMTLPVVTLMLTALVQKRSFARSDSRKFSTREDTIQDYLEQVQRAVECYEKKRKKRDTNVDEC